MASAALSDDSYVTLGRRITAGGGSTSAANDDDPYVTAGRAITAAAPPVAPGAATPAGPVAAAPLGVITGIPAIDHAIAGGLQGARDVISTGVNAAKWVDDRVPALAALDRLNDLEPGPIQANLAAGRSAYDASPAGQSYAGMAGRFGGNILASAPLGGVASKAIGIGAGAAADAAGAVAPWLGRGVSAVGDLLSGSASAPQAGVVPNLLLKGTSRALQGGIAGAGYGAATSGGSDDSLVENMLAGAKTGAIAGPALATTAKIASSTASGVKNWVGQFTGKTEAAEIENALAAARARSGAPAIGESGAPPPAAPIAPPTAPPGSPPSAPGASPAGPQSVGAASSRDLSLPGALDQAADEAHAARVAGFEERMSRQPKAGFDNAEYIKDGTATTAEMYADPVLAQQQRVLAAGSPEMTAIDRNNNGAAFRHFDQIGPGPMELNTLGRTRRANADANLAVAFNPATKGEADAAPTMAHIQTILDGPDGKLEPVQAALAKVQKALQTRDGKALETDPAQLYGVGKMINYQMSKLGGAETPGNLDETVKRALQSIKQSLYDQIEPAAPGFAKYRADYQRDSVSINVGKMLQEYRPMLLRGNDGATMSLDPVNSMLKQIGKRLGSDDPLDAAKSLTEDQVDQLFNLRSHLQRQNNRYLARPAGSNTQHDLDLAAEMGLHGVAGAANHLLGRIPVAGDIASNALENVARNASSRNKSMLTNRLLFPQHPMVPPDGGY